MIHYPTVFNVGHKAITSLFDGPVVVQEKVDGSQLKWGRTPDKGLWVASKGRELNLDAPDKMFFAAVNHLTKVADRMTPGWVYAGEYLQNPRHNILAYDRTPKNHIVLFDIDTGEQDYAGRATLELSAWGLDIDVIPVLAEGEFTGLNDLSHFLDTPSYLGGQQVEGIVIKNYGQFTPEKKVAMGKLVRPEFREMHAHAAKTPGLPLVEGIIAKYKTEARWHKAVQHLRETGTLLDDPKDIGPLMREVHLDIEKECRDDILADLYAACFNQIKKGVTNGLADWYKQQLYAAP